MLGAKVETLPAIQEPIAQPSIEMLLSQAIDKGVSVETLERLLAMRKELNAEYAQGAFYKAMSAFQEACPIIQKKKSVTTNSSVVAYRYAPIEAIVAQVKHLLKEHGFSYSIETSYNGAHYVVTCIARHTLGHSEARSYPAIPDLRENKMQSEIQRIASALTFAKRYAFCNAFGILTGDEDNDARPQGNNGVVKVTPEQVAFIRELIKKTNFTEAKLLKKNYGVDTIEALTPNKALAFQEWLTGYLREKDDIPF